MARELRILPPMGRPEMTKTNARTSSHASAAPQSKARPSMPLRPRRRATATSRPRNAYSITRPARAGERERRPKTASCSVSRSTSRAAKRTATRAAAASTPATAATKSYAAVLDAAVLQAPEVNGNTAHNPSARQARRTSAAPESPSCLRPLSLPPRAIRIQIEHVLNHPRRRDTCGLVTPI
jgi:hypothetical protein